MKIIFRKVANVLYFIVWVFGLPLMIWGINKDVTVWSMALPATGWSSESNQFVSVLSGMKSDQWQRAQQIAEQRQKSADKWNVVFPYKIPSWVYDLVVVYGLYAFFGLMGWFSCQVIRSLMKELPDDVT
jgi:hypothetical protein